PSLRAIAKAPATAAPRRQPGTNPTPTRRQPVPTRRLEPTRSEPKFPGQLIDAQMIERQLRAREPRLASMFTIFSTLTKDERLPAIETIEARPWRWLTEPSSNDH